MSACPRVVDISRRKPGPDTLLDTANPISQLVNSTAALTKLQKNTVEVRTYWNTGVCMVRVSVSQI